MSADPQASLADLRVEIDRIDEALHRLLIERAGLVMGVAAAKKREGGADAPLSRPGREAAMLRHRIASNRAPLPETLVMQLWRSIVVALTRLQGRFVVGVATGPRGGSEVAAEAQTHYGAGDLKYLGDARKALAAVSAGRVQLAVLPAPGGRDGAWWTKLPRGVSVLARLPFLTTPRAKGDGALVVGRQQFEPSGDDRYYLVVRQKGLTRAALAKKLPRDARIVATAPGAVLIDAPGAEIAGLAVGCIGGYARPIVLPSQPRS